MTPTFSPTTIQKIGTELAIAWSDGTESYLPLEALRRACPCATCGGEPDVVGRVVRPDLTYTPESFDLAGWEMIGGYGFQPQWADGHKTGIFTFPYLRRLGGALENGR